MSLFSEHESEIVEAVWDGNPPKSYAIETEPLLRISMVAIRLVELGYNFAITQQNGRFTAHFEGNDRLKVCQDLSAFDAILRAALRILRVAEEVEPISLEQQARAATAKHPKPKKGRPRKGAVDIA